MTCIAGLIHEGKVYMGGDSAGISGWDLTIRADRKVFRNGPFVAGFTSSFRMGQLLKYSLVPPEHPEGMDAHQYMATKFVDAVRTCLKDGGYAKSNSGEESAGAFLVGYRGHLYEISSDYQVGEAEDLYAAVGCGAATALGALCATRSMEPMDRIKLALCAAERHSAGVRGPFHIEVLEA